jgi:hypothetical protein
MYQRRNRPPGAGRIVEKARSWPESSLIETLVLRCRSDDASALETGEQPAILGGRFPAHSADHAYGFHLHAPE